MLDENTLKQGIEEAFKLGAAAGSYPAVAALLAKAIHTYVNTAEIKINNNPGRKNIIVKIAIMIEFIIS